MKLPAGTQVIDATGKWVTPGIVAGFSRLGLAEVDLSRGDGVRRHQPPTGRSARRSTSSRRSIRSSRADRGQPRRRRHARARRAQRRQEHLRRPGRGDRHRRRHGPDHRGRGCSSSSSLARPAQDKAGGSRSSAHVLFRNALREAAELGRYALADSGQSRRRRPTSAIGRSSAIPTNRGSTDRTRAAARTCS